MSVFICWSGTRSHIVAKAVKKLLNSTVPALSDPDHVFVSDSIEKGVAWFDSIIDELDNARAGVVCLTAENLRSPWMHFEAGALARGLAALPATAVQSTPAASLGGGREQVPARPAPAVHEPEQAPHHPSAHRNPLFTVLHGVTGAETDGPLSAYQGTSTTRREMGELVRALRLIFGDQLPTEQPIIPDDDWTTFECTLRQAVVPARTLVRDLERLFQRKTFNEPLHHCADQAWLARYEGAKFTLESLRPFLERVKAACAVHEHGLFEMLLAELDSYGMAIHALLLTPKTFRLGDNGELEMDPGIRTSCEDRRLAIRSLVGRLLHPVDNPLLPEAIRFMAAETNEERKMIIHRLEGRIRGAREETYEDVFKGSNRQFAVDEAIDRLTRVLFENQLERDDEADEEEGHEQETSASQVPPDESAIDVATAAGRGDPATNPPTRLLRFRESSWDLDRIYYYLLVQYFDIDALRWEWNGGTAASKGPPAQPNSDAETTVEAERRPLDHDLFCAARDVEMEIERYRARAKGGSLTPLTYALVALQVLRPKRAAAIPTVQAAVTSAVALVKEELADMLRTEQGRPIARLLADIW